MKEIVSPKDMAVNGAAPAYTVPIHVGNPVLGSRELFDAYIDRIYENNWLTNNGPLVQQLEQEIASYHDVKHCVAMTNGTIALEIAIRALGLGGEVIVPSFTFVATVHALHWQAITPVFADICPATHALDPEAVVRAITAKTTGIIAVHLWGRPCAVEELESIAKDHDLKLLFDSAHAFGCSHKGTMIGSFGACEVLSFHATKYFNTFEGGAILSNDDELVEKLRLMRNFGFSGMDNVIYPGTNGKMSEVAAAMGLVNLSSLDSILDINHRNYLAYCENFEGVKELKVLDLESDVDSRRNYQYVVLELAEKYRGLRDGIIEMLHAENILARRYFWPGCHKMQPYRELYPDADDGLFHTNNVAARVIVLPTGAAVGLEDIDMITTLIKSYLAWQEAAA